MRMNYRNLVTALLVAASVMASGALSDANAANSDAVMAYEGHWNGRAILDCAGVTAPMEIVIQGGDMSGEVTVRGQGQGDGTYTISGYIDRKGRISDGRLRGPVSLNMRGSLSDHEGKGQFHGPECSGSWKVVLDDVTPQQDEIAAVPASAPADQVPPVIDAPGEMRTEQPVIEIAGRVSDASAIVEFTVNGAAAPLEADGSFRLQRGVALGQSELVIAALDEWGNEAEQRVRVTRSAPTDMPLDSPGAERQTATLGQQDDDKQAPRINLPPKLVTEDREIDIAGSVSDESAIVEMFVNERRVALGSDGSFRVRQRLKLGINKFAFRATDEWGNRAEKRIDVERKRLDLALGSYHALVIGNNEYRNMPKLKTAVADAKAISRVLEDRYGFSVTTLINATRYDVIGAMSELRATLAYDTNLLIYYAGHGVVDPVTECGYWLPVEAEQSNPANWVSNDDITDMLKAIPARHILVIADSCNSGTLVRAAPIDLETWEDRRDWLKRIVEKRSRTALASGGLEPVADASSGGHSVFAAALLNVLHENSEIIEAHELFAPVRKAVVLNANQTPIYSDIRLAGHDGGDFIFAPK